MEEIESGRSVEIDTRSKSVRRDWAERARARRERLLEGLRRARADLIEISTEGDVAEPIVRCFQGRARPGARAGRASAAQGGEPVKPRSWLSIARGFVAAITVAGLRGPSGPRLDRGRASIATPAEVEVGEPFELVLELEGPAGVDFFDIARSELELDESWVAFGALTDPPSASTSAGERRVLRRRWTLASPRAGRAQFGGDRERVGCRPRAFPRFARARHVWRSAACSEPRKTSRARCADCPSASARKSRRPPPPGGSSPVGRRSSSGDSCWPLFGAGARVRRSVTRPGRPPKSAWSSSVRSWRAPPVMAEAPTRRPFTERTSP